MSHRSIFAVKDSMSTAAGSVVKFSMSSFVSSSETYAGSPRGVSRQGEGPEIGKCIDGHGMQVRIKRGGLISLFLSFKGP